MKRLASLTFCMLFVFTAKAQEVHFDFDRNINFTLYKTYVFVGWQEDSDRLINDLDRKRLRNAFRNEFAIRKIKRDTINPDFAVSLFLVVDKKTTTTPTEPIWVEPVITVEAGAGVRVLRQPPSPKVIIWLEL